MTNMRERRFVALAARRRACSLAVAAALLVACVFGISCGGAASEGQNRAVTTAPSVAPSGTGPPSAPTATTFAPTPSVTVPTRGTSTPTEATTAPPSPTAAPAPATPGPERPAEAIDRALIAAAKANDLPRVRMLLGQGASVRASGPDGETALIAAAYALNLEAAEVLIAAGADVNTQDSSRQGAYLIATSEVGDSERALALLRLTLANGADVRTLDSYNGTGLIRAADRGYLEIVRELLKTSIAIDHVNNLGWTALLEAVILGRGDARHVAVVRALVAAGVNANIADRSGVTPLAVARIRAQQRRRHDGGRRGIGRGEGPATRLHELAQRLLRRKRSPGRVERPSLRTALPCRLSRDKGGC